MGPATSFMLNSVDTAVSVSQRPLHPQNKTTGYLPTKPTMAGKINKCFLHKVCRANKRHELLEGKEEGNAVSEVVLMQRINE